MRKRLVKAWIEIGRVCRHYGLCLQLSCSTDLRGWELGMRVGHRSNGNDRGPPEKRKERQGRYVELLLFFLSLSVRQRPLFFTERRTGSSEDADAKGGLLVCGAADRVVREPRSLSVIT